MPPLKIYKASAGSGKTFALTLEYLVLLFRNPDAFRHILAVTFTNKAAGEMKERILRRLHRMAHDPGGRGAGDLDLLEEATGMDREMLSRRSAALLSAILNDYSSFSVGTIDRFFQSVIRAFTREIGIQPAYNLELDSRYVLTLGVERLFRDIDGDADLQNWLIRYAEERMEQARGWNFQEELIQLGMELFNESFQELFAAHGMEVLDREGLGLFLQKLRSEQANSERTIRSYGKMALDLMAAEGLAPEDFKGRSRSPALMFRKALEEGEVDFTDSRLKAMEDADRWLPSGAGVSMRDLLEGRLLPLLGELHGEQLQVNTIKAIRRHYYTMGILGDLQQRVQSYLKENNLFLISDSGRFLRGIIGANQVPFVYERTGTRFRHIMLDEFQDTSVFQYDNFRPLLDNSLASGHENLLVGDVKQSIYRWRNSDWRILSEGVEQDFTHQEVDVRSLKRNHRSSEQVIRFNNSVFQLSAKVLGQEIAADPEAARSGREVARLWEERFRSAYSDAVQELSASTAPGGHVKLEFFQNDEGKDYRKAVLEVLPEWILELQEHGVGPGETAILVRTGREGILVARTLLEYGRRNGNPDAFRLVSNDSLLLEQNDAVILLLSAMHYLSHPGDLLNAALLKQRFVARSGSPALSDVMDSSLSPGEILPASFSGRMEELVRMPLYELVDSLVGIFDLGSSEDDLPFIRGFQEEVLDAVRRDAPDLNRFLEYWKQKGGSRAIQLSEGGNAIRIMTIHRAKGLEFRAVLIPFCNWEITTDARKLNILWCSTEGTPFNDLPLVPLKYSKDLEQTFFAHYYYQERMKGYLDNLNLMYVAFTRAVECLYIGLPDREEDQKDRLKTCADLVHSIMDRKPAAGPCLEALSFYRDGGCCSIGDLPPAGAAAKAGEVGDFRLGRSAGPQKFPSLLMRSDSWLPEGEEDAGDRRIFGNMMHMLFSRILYRDDLSRVLNAMQEEGLMSAEEKKELSGQVGDLLRKEEIRDWFEAREGRRVLNERSLFTGSGTLLRPDRVIIDPEVVRVIDFKFGRKENPGHREQVMEYGELLRKMDYPRVEAWLWYVSLDKVLKVDEL